MSDFLMILVSVVVGSWFFIMLDYWRWSRCDCGAEKMPFLYKRHCKEWLMWFIAGGNALAMFSAALTGSLFASFLSLFATFYWLKMAVDHHKRKKRKMLSRILGRIRITEFGRLAIDHKAG